MWVYFSEGYCTIFFLQSILYVSTVHTVYRLIVTGIMLKSLRVLIPLTRRPYWNRRGENFLLRHRKPCQRKNVTLLKRTRKGWTQEEKKNLFKSSSYYKRYEECITLLGLTLDACDNIVIFKTICTCFFFVFLLPVLEVCGCNWRLLSELRAVGTLFFHSTLTTARY